MKEEVTAMCHSLQGLLPVPESSEIKHEYTLLYTDGILSNESTFVPSARRQCPGQHST